MSDANTVRVLLRSIERGRAEFVETHLSEPTVLKLDEESYRVLLEYFTANVTPMIYRQLYKVSGLSVKVVSEPEWLEVCASW